ncbi:protein kinase [Legionella birminghamensis]|uniref:Protein kinase n=1 Tax=Legionella birminghamensis TaxID=28083 RepID=A0A378ICF2_9GAMM|nr:serine/threonine-protein kinase [Legionella birminghamensis]KTC66758.1 protein kinase [Legionella birminghamensis]STX32907.1 protein kinase [Legionella birminghamensis]
MPKYSCATEDEDSSYESDDGSSYFPAATAQYKLVEYNPPQKISHRSIQIEPVFGGINYFLGSKHNTQRGYIAFKDLCSETKGLTALSGPNWFEEVVRYSRKIIDIVLNNKHGRKGYLATGTYSSARLFSAKSSLQEERRKTKVVLDPVRCDYKESRKKYHFFKSLYPHENSFYMEDQSKDTYRLVLPNIQGSLYGDLPLITDSNEQVKLFLATIKALKDCHSKHIVCLDLNPYNIKYIAPCSEYSLGRSFLIDGGFSNAPGEIIDTEFFRCETEEKLTRRLASCDYIAPECWYIGIAPFASESMDIYSMGKILTKMMSPLSPELIPYLEACCEQEPCKRPTLEELEQWLECLLHLNETYSPLM